MVRPLLSSELESAVRVLEHAFAADPALSYVLPDEVDRERIGPHIARAFLRYGMSHGTVWVTDDLQGVALRRPPGREEMSLLGMLSSGIAWLPFRLGWRGTRRLLAAERETNQRHRRIVRGPHWYLWMIGVHPDHQGRGLGAALMARTFDEADAVGVPCYLETSDRRALSIHLHHGFDIIEQGVVPGTDLMVWSMVRPPRRRLALVG